MKRILVLIAAAITLSVSVLHAQNVKKTFDFGDFKGISASYAHKIYITKGSSNKIEATFPERYADYLDYYVSDGILYLKMDSAINKDRKLRNHKEEDEFIVKVQMEEIKSISLSGATEVTATGVYNTNDFKLKMSGASEINDALNINATNFSYQLSGASEASVKGEFDKIWGEISGASGLEINANATSLDMQTSGASEFNFKGKANSIKVECSGASEVDLEGSTTDIAIECSGASDVNASEMVAENAKASASGASSIHVFGNNRLELKTSGASTIKYYGEARDLVILSHQSIKRGN